GRTVTSTQTGTSSRRGARYDNQRSEAASDHWRSSTASTSGRASAIFTASQYSPCATANISSSLAAASTTYRGSKSRRACIAAPSNSRSRAASSAPLPSGSKSSRTTPHPNDPPPSTDRVSHTTRTASNARDRASVKSEVFPIPGGPSTTNSRPLPRPHSASTPSAAASIGARSSNAPKPKFVVSPSVTSHDLPI